MVMFLLAPPPTSEVEGTDGGDDSLAKNGLLLSGKQNTSMLSLTRFQKVIILLLPQVRDLILPLQL